MYSELYATKVRYNEQKNVQPFLQHCCKTSWWREGGHVARFTTNHIQTCLTKYQVAAGCKNLLQKVQSSSTSKIATKSIHVARFTGPRQTCSAARDVTPVYGRVTPS